MTVKQETYPPIDGRYVSLLWAEAEAAQEIAAMHAALFDPPWEEDSLRNMLIDPGTSALLARVRLRNVGPAAPAGFAISRTAADEAEILTIGVTAPFQRRGIGRRLAQGLLRAVTTLGAKRLFLEVATDNESALGLYRSLNFEEVGRREGYYKRRDGMMADALTLSCDLNQAP
ncbi:MAG: GNAT family N-acetyltransferase [Alphaproteobacteria bacterium]|nr:GNAT family N-acetyltransferase [Alphaproteobacteria bacterium]